MPAETQDVEGNNSVLAEMARRAPCIGVALATARTSIKKGRPITPDERVALHTEVVRFQLSNENADRFEPIGDRPAPHDAQYCSPAIVLLPRHPLQRLMAAAFLASARQQDVVFGAGFVSKIGD